MAWSDATSVSLVFVSPGQVGKEARLEGPRGCRQMVRKKERERERERERGEGRGPPHAHIYTPDSPRFFFPDQRGSHFGVLQHNLGVVLHEMSVHFSRTSLCVY